MRWTSKIIQHESSVAKKVKINEQGNWTEEGDEEEEEKEKGEKKRPCKIGYGEG